MTPPTLCYLSSPSAVFWLVSPQITGFVSLHCHMAQPLDMNFHLFSFPQMIPSKHTLKTIKTYGYKCIFPIEPFPMNSTYTYPNCLLYDSIWISNRHIEFNLSKTKLLISLPNVFYLQFSLSRGMPAMLSKCQIRKLTAILDSPLFPIPYTQYCRQFFWLCLQNIPRL